MYLKLVKNLYWRLFIKHFDFFMRKSSIDSYLEKFVQFLFFATMSVLTACQTIEIEKNYVEMSNTNSLMQENKTITSEITFDGNSSDLNTFITESQDFNPTTKLQNSNSKVVLEERKQVQLKRDEKTNQVADEVRDSIIWQIQASEHNKKIEEATVPEGQDPLLTNDALEAAFALFSKKSEPAYSMEKFLIPSKKDGVTRVGVLVPLSDVHKSLGHEIRRGIEMALFKINDPNIEILFLDTKAGEKARSAALFGLENGVDIFIGPLFSRAAIFAQEVVSVEGVPMLLLSNNIEVANPDSWILGYLPEQQIDGLLGHAITTGKRQFAIIAQDDPFGLRLKDHAIQRLSEFDLQPSVIVLSREQLSDQIELDSLIRDFTGYVTTVSDASIKESRFDTVIFAGDSEFALSTAPVLAYYDVGPESALYLGNSLWDHPQVLSEPSLQGGVFTSRPKSLDSEFEKKWSDLWNSKSGILARLGFDAMAIVGALVSRDREEWSKGLLNNSGFFGYSGTFKLLPNGQNIRAFEVRKVFNGQSKIVKPAPDRI